MKTLSEMMIALHHKRLFPYEVLAQILGIDVAILTHCQSHEGNWNLIFSEEQYVNVMSTITFLYYLDDNADMRVYRFLQVLLDYHRIPEETIASYAGITKEELIAFQEDPIHIDGQVKYKIAAVVMSLRYMCKDSEENQEK